MERILPFLKTIGELGTASRLEVDPGYTVVRFSRGSVFGSATMHLEKQGGAGSGGNRRGTVTFALRFEKKAGLREAVWGLRRYLAEDAEFRRSLVERARKELAGGSGEKLLNSGANAAEARAVEQIERMTRGDGKFVEKRDGGDADAILDFLLERGVAGGGSGPAENQARRGYPLTLSLGPIEFEAGERPSTSFVNALNAQKLREAPGEVSLRRAQGRNTLRMTVEPPNPSLIRPASYGGVAGERLNLATRMQVSNTATAPTRPPHQSHARFVKNPPEQRNFSGGDRQHRGLEKQHPAIESGDGTLVSGGNFKFTTPVRLTFWQRVGRQLNRFCEAHLRRPRNER